MNNLTDRRCIRSGLRFTPENNERVHPQIKIWQTARSFSDLRDEVQKIIAQGKTEGWDDLDQFQAPILDLLRNRSRPTLTPWEEVRSLLDSIDDKDVEIPRYAGPHIIYKYRIGVAFNIWSDQYLCIAELQGVLSVWRITEWVAPTGSEGIWPSYVNMKGDRYGVQYHGHDRAARILELLPQCPPEPVGPPVCWTSPEGAVLIPTFPNAVFATREESERYGYRWDDQERQWYLAHSPHWD
jgi:hypothetical protein